MNADMYRMCLNCKSLISRKRSSVKISSSRQRYVPNIHSGVCCLSKWLTHLLLWTPAGPPVRPPGAAPLLTAGGLQGSTAGWCWYCPSCPVWHQQRGMMTTDLTNVNIWYITTSWVTGFSPPKSPHGRIGAVKCKWSVEEAVTFWGHCAHQSRSPVTQRSDMMDATAKQSATWMLACAPCTCSWKKTGDELMKGICLVYWGRYCMNKMMDTT